MDLDYNTLLDEYNKLFVENQKLKAENNDLKKRLALMPMEEICINSDDDVLSDQVIEASIQETSIENVNNNSSSVDKINLFISLFRGREDVYAKRWQNREGKSGYVPVCINEWIRGKWKERLEKFLIINKKLTKDSIKKEDEKNQSKIGQVGAGKNYLNSIIDIDIMQSLVKGDEVKEVVKN